RDRGMRDIGLRLLSRLEPGQAQVHFPRPEVELVLLRVLPLGHVRKQELQDHLLRKLGARIIGGDLHPLFGIAAARRRERALALDLDHAGAAVTVGPHAGLVAKVRDLDAVLLRRLDDRLVGTADDGLAVELELNGHHRELLGRNAFHRQRASLPIYRLSTLLSRAGNTASPSARDSAPPAPGHIWKRPSWPEKVP